MSGIRTRNPKASIWTQVLTLAMPVLGRRWPPSSKLERKTVTRNSREKIAAAIHQGIPPQSAKQP